MSTNPFAIMLGYFTFLLLQIIFYIMRKNGLSSNNFMHLNLWLLCFSQDIIPIEGLKLDHVKAGIYMLHCLPLRLIGCDGSPIRCILIKWSRGSTAESDMVSCQLILHRSENATSVWNKMLHSVLICSCLCTQQGNINNLLLTSPCCMKDLQ
jgi:hypothetical protein